MPRPAGDGLGRAGDQPAGRAGLGGDDGAIIGDKHAALVDEAQRKARLAAARWTADQNAGPVQRNAARMQALLAHRHRRRPARAGNRTSKRAPATQPSVSSRLDATIEPP